MMGLTLKQRECLDFIRAYVREHGVAPTLREIKDALGLTSKATVSHLLKCLVERGHIKIKPTLRRSIKLVQPKYDHSADCLCAACPARRLQYQKFIEGLQTQAEFPVRIRLSGFRIPTVAERADLLGKKFKAAPLTRTAIPSGVR